MLMSAGEQISVALLSMALSSIGCQAISLTGWQAGFHTDRAYTRARIKRLDCERIESELSRNRVVVVAGFQGINKNDDDITTLGRGGSDTSAVAIAAALHADLCQIYTDVDGVYTADPRLVPNARKLPQISFDEMLELASLGAQVLNNRSVELAKNILWNGGALVAYRRARHHRREVAPVEGMLIKGVTKNENVAVISLLEVPDVPGMSFNVFSPDGPEKINVGIILQASGRGNNKDLIFTVPWRTCTPPWPFWKRICSALAPPRCWWTPTWPR